MWFLLCLNELCLPSLPARFRDAWLNSLITRCIKQLSLLLLLDEKGDWFSVWGQLQLTGIICHPLSSKYLFSEVTLAFSNYFFFTPPPSPIAGLISFPMETQGSWHVTEMDGAEAWLKWEHGGDEEAGGRELLWRELCHIWGMRRSHTSVDDTMQTPVLQRAPHCHREQHCPV